MPTPVIVSAHQGAGIGSAAVTVPGVEPGDVLLEFAGNIYGSGGPTMGGQGAGARAEIGARLGAPNSPQFRNANLASYRRDATEGGTFTSSVSWTDETMLIVLLLRLAGALDGAPSGATGAQSSSNPAAVQAPSVSTTTDAPLLVGAWVGVQFSGSLGWVPQASMVERAEVAPNGYTSLMVATEVRGAGTGATGARSATASPVPSHGWASRLVAVSGVEAPAGPEPGRMLMAC